MKFIVDLITAFLAYFLGLFIGYICKTRDKENTKQNDYKKSYEIANCKLIKIDLIIRMTRNHLLNRQTKLRRTTQNNNESLEYITTSANVELITQLEEAIRNEM